MIADVFHGVPDGWVLGIAGSVTGGIGWLIKHVTSRSAERATALQANASHDADNRVNVQIRAFDSLERQITNLQGQVEQQTIKTERLEKDYGDRLRKLERRNGRMNNFIVRLLDAYLQIKAYVSVLETIVSQTQANWKRREFPEITLPCFEDEVDTEASR